MYLSPPDHPKCPGFGLWVYGISRKRHPFRPVFGVAILEFEYPVLEFEYRKRAGISRVNPRNTSLRVSKLRLRETRWDSNFFGGEKLFLGPHMLRNDKKHSNSPRKIIFGTQIGATVEILEVKIFSPLFLSTLANFGKLKSFFFEWWHTLLTILRYSRHC